MHQAPHHEISTVEWFVPLCDQDTMVKIRAVCRGSCCCVLKVGYPPSGSAPSSTRVDRRRSVCRPPKRDCRQSLRNSVSSRHALKSCVVRSPNLWCSGSMRQEALDHRRTCDDWIGCHVLSFCSISRRSLHCYIVLKVGATLLTTLIATQGVRISGSCPSPPEPETEACICRLLMP